MNAFQAENVTNSLGRSVNIKTYTNKALYRNEAEQNLALYAAFQLFLYLVFSS